MLVITRDDGVLLCADGARKCNIFNYTNQGLHENDPLRSELGWHLIIFGWLVVKIQLPLRESIYRFARCARGTQMCVGWAIQRITR